MGGDSQTVPETTPRLKLGRLAGQVLNEAEAEVEGSKAHGRWKYHVLVRHVSVDLTWASGYGPSGPLSVVWCACVTSARDICMACSPSHQILYAVLLARWPSGLTPGQR